MSAVVKLELDRLGCLMMWLSGGEPRIRRSVGGLTGSIVSSHGIRFERSRTSRHPLFSSSLARMRIARSACVVGDAFGGAIARGRS